ncbi:unnamed protein product [Ceutorhynchus assimilis]|uniref:Uncharacterized protein n=1 Tax=Ceutorhynchus assimilis TaxID=467358 RepID=A0A9N9QKI8_9CUCU|nr:unnamed protein product [Ceutorhynchus assimilis]
MTEPSSFIILTSSMPGMVLTDSFFNTDCNFLSSVAWVEWTTFFFLLGVPLPPILTCDCNFFNFSLFILNPWASNAAETYAKPVATK